MKASGLKGLMSRPNQSITSYMQLMQEGVYLDPEAGWQATATLSQHEYPAKTVARSGLTSSPRNASGGYTQINAYSALYEDCGRPPVCTISVPHPSGLIARQRSIPYFGSAFLDPATALNQASFNLSQKLKLDAPNLAVAMGERKSTARLLLQSATRIVQAARYTAKGNFGRAFESLNAYVDDGITSRHSQRTGRFPPNSKVFRDSAAQAWLEMQYGWKPLLRDVYGAFNSLHDLVSRPDYISYDCKGSDSAFEAITYENVDGDTFVIGSRSKRVDVRSKVSFRLTPGDINSLNAMSLGITNPALVAWELVPFSFVVDWFIPVGNYLDAMATLSCMPSPASCYTSIKSTCVTSTGGLAFEPGYGTNATVEYSGSVVNGTSFSRSLSTPGLTIPDFKNPMSASHFASALSLIISNFPKLRN